MSRRYRWVAVASLAFIALALAGEVVYPAEPEFVGEPGSIAAFYEANVDGLLIAGSLYLLSVVVLLAFAGGLAGALRRQEGGDGVAARACFAGAAAGAGLMLAAASMDMVAALRVDERGAIDPQVAAVMWDLSNALFGLAAPAAFAVTTLAVGVLALRGVGLPRWHGVLSVALGVAMIVPPISYVAMIVFLFWVPATGVALAMGEHEAPARSGAREVPAVA